MELKSVLEAILFSSQQPLSPKELRDVLTRAAEHAEASEAREWKKTSVANIQAALAQLEEEYAQLGRSFHLVCVAGAWQFVSQPEYAPWIGALVGPRHRPTRLSQAALETLAIIAYRQPLTRADIEQIRGVSVDGVMQTLLERGLVHQVGRAELPGRPATYGTTPLFLEYFGLRNLDELPASDELRRLAPAPKPAGLATADSGLATAPPDALAQAEAPEVVDPALADSPEPDPASNPANTSAAAEAASEADVPEVEAAARPAAPENPPSAPDSKP